MPDKQTQLRDFRRFLVLVPRVSKSLRPPIRRSRPRPEDAADHPERPPLKSNEPARAIEALQVTTPYELGSVGDMTLYPVYVRGEAYLSAHQGNEAAAEFQKIFDHRGIVVNEPIGGLAHLQIGRAYAMSGDIAKAKAAYQVFLTLWKDADPDIPILKEAKMEYARLR